MRINKIECKQFAGLLDSEYEFRGGLNIVVGENESGKSTLADLLYYLFFQDTKLSGRNKEDNAFQEKACPNRTGPYQGNRIDGTLYFETHAGTARLTKEWSGKNGRAELKLPTGVYITEPEDIKKYLAEQLKFGKGVYDEIAFASQRRTQTILSSLLGENITNVNTESNIAALSAVITKTVMETGGIALEKMEEDMKKRVSSYEGRWDFVNQMPEGGRRRGLENRWKNGTGSIIAAYYEKEEVAAAQHNAEEAEKKYETAQRQLRSKEEELKRQKEKQRTFLEARPRIESRKNLLDLWSTAEKDVDELSKAFENWPKEENGLSHAKELQAELQAAQRKEKYKRVSSWKHEEARLLRDINAKKIDEQDFTNACELEKRISALEAKLKGINLSARIKKLGDSEVYIQSSLTGTPIKLKDDTTDITEAASILIPDVVEIQLSPKNVDVASIKVDLSGMREEIAGILQRYHAQTVDELRKNRESVGTWCIELRTCQQYISNALGEETWEELQKAAEIPDDGKSVSAIQEEIRAFCPRGLEYYIGSASTNLEAYRKKYGNYEVLQNKKAQRENDVKKYRELLEETKAIPAEFTKIEDTVQYSRELQSTVDHLEEDVNDLNDIRNDAYMALPEKSAEEYAEAFQQKRAIFERLIAEHTRWKHIQEVFLQIKEATRQNPFEDIGLYFGQNLSQLSGGRLSLVEVQDNLSSSICSGTSRLTSKILSAGTKDTILLAFRLAVLKHLFPNGGCVTVFDDPFTDMDPKRTRRACQLLQEFAEHNQVIFTTCDEKYTKYMSGNVINMSEGAKVEA